HFLQTGGTTAKQGSTAQAAQDGRGCLRQSVGKAVDPQRRGGGFCRECESWRRQLADFLHHAGGPEERLTGGNHPLRGRPSLPHEVSGSSFWRLLGRRRRLRDVRLLRSGGLN